MRLLMLGSKWRKAKKPGKKREFDFELIERVKQAQKTLDPTSTPEDKTSNPYEGILESDTPYVETQETAEDHPTTENTTDPASTSEGENSDPYHGIVKTNAPEDEIQKKIEDLRSRIGGSF